MGWGEEGVGWGERSASSSLLLTHSSRAVAVDTATWP